MDRETRENIVEKLELCITELPFSRWSEAAIFDACDQFIADHGRPLYLNDFTSRELPSHPTVKNRFGMTLREFRDRYYPLPRKEYRTIDGVPLNAQGLIRAFGEEFNRIGARTREDYDRRRNKQYPCSAFLLKVSRAASWAELLNMANVSYADKRREKEACYGTFRLQYRQRLDNGAVDG